MDTSEYTPHSSSRFLCGLPCWVLAATAVSLVAAMTFWAIGSNRREEKIIVQNFVNRAEALIWALEAGTRAWMVSSGDCVVLQKLMDETARQPGIVFLAITDKDGEIFEVRKIFAPLDGTPAGFPADFTDHAHAPGSRTCADISPGSGQGRGRGLGLGRLLGRRRNQQDGTHQSEPMKSHIFVGMDNAPVAMALAEDLHHNILTAALVAVIGIGGMLSLMYFHNHRRSRQTGPGGFGIIAVCPPRATGNITFGRE